jgi:hypothetical protein
MKSTEKHQLRNWDLVWAPLGNSIKNGSKTWIKMIAKHFCQLNSKMSIKLPLFKIGPFILKKQKISGPRPHQGGQAPRGSAPEAAATLGATRWHCCTPGLTVHMLGGFDKG